MNLIYETNNTLYHYGVPGMKWGQRRAQKRAARADRRLSKAIAARQHRKKQYIMADKKARSKYGNNPKSEPLNKALAKNKAKYTNDKIYHDYNVARKKAKKDPNYKNSKEYITAKKTYNKRLTNNLLYGAKDVQKVDELKYRGYTDKQAKTRVIVASAATALAYAAADYVIKNKL